MVFSEEKEKVNLAARQKKLTSSASLKLKWQVSNTNVAEKKKPDS